MPDLPYGWSVFEASEIGAIPERPIDNIQCEEDIYALFADDSDERGRCSYTCGYCGSAARTTLAPALNWFQSHKCQTDEFQAKRNDHILEQRAILWDLGAMEEDHPFAA